MQHLLASAGPQARHIEVLWWLMLMVCSAVFIAVFAVVAALAVSVVLLVALALASFFTASARS